LKSSQEYELEIETLKKQIKQKDLKIADLETEKKTLKMKLQIQQENFEDWKKENKLSVKEKQNIEKEMNETRRKHDLYIEQMKYERRKFKDEIENLQIAVANLQDRLNKDSSNSSIPSSVEKIYTKRKCVNTSREKTDRRTGGQPGHKGSGLTKEKAKELIESGKAEHVTIEHVLEGADVSTSECIIKYELDIEIKTKVIEHRFYVKESANEIPEEYNTDVQYGDNVKTFATVALNEGFISLNRTANIINEMTNNTINLSEGTLVNFNKELAKNSKGSVEKIKEALIMAKVLNVDETGVRVNGELNWLHTAVSEYYTYYQIESKRGKDGISNLGILEYFVGVLVHDHFVSYYKYKSMTHAECNAHILRYLKLVIELFQRKGAEEFLEFLIEINNNRKALEMKNIHAFSKVEIEDIEAEYSKLLNNWEREYLKYVKGKRKTQSLIDEENLFKRLKEYKEQHLQFAKDFSVPFSNNNAEKSLRLIKTKMKVSGCFRGNDNGANFATIRSLFETTKKQGLNLFESVRKTFNKKELEFIKA